MGLTFNNGRNAAAMTSTSSLNVGIGTASASFPAGGGLAINNATRSNLTLTDGTNVYNVFQDTTSAYHDLRTAGNIIWRNTTGNTERMRITAAGEFLIGTTTSNGFKFKVSNSGAEEVAINPGDSANVNSYVNYNRSTSSYIAANYNASKHCFLGGNVGIGTSSPSIPLAVLGGDSTYPTANGTIVSGSATSIFHYNGRGTVEASGTSSALFGMTVNATPSGYIYHDGTNYRLLNYVSGGAMTFGTEENERMRITSSGNVGIGTSSPSAKLHTEVSSSGWVAKIINTNTSTDNAGLLIKAGVNSGNEIILAQKANGTSAFLVDASGAVTTPLQPSFRAYYSVNSFWNLNTSDVFIFDLTEYNIGGCYNTSNGRFTAPVAGVYQFNFYSIVYGAVTNGGISLRKNGGFPASGYNVHFSPTLAGAWSNVVYTTSIYLSAGDYVNVLNIGPYTQFHGKDWSSFSGYLVG